MPLPSGMRFGPYEVTGFIGAGGMGEVYRALDTRLNREVAIKLLSASFAADPERLRRFTVEAQSASALNHPNILTVYDVGEHDNAPYLVMELLEGESLRERMDRGELGFTLAVDYARQAATGLAAAHARRIVHRDIKPDNLFVTRDGRVKILDFGLAKMAPGAVASADDSTVLMAGQTSAGLILGTVAYMSPEQARGQAVDSRSDIFSFGCVLYEMLTGTKPFGGETIADAMGAILLKEPDLGAIAAPSPRRVVARCLEKSAERRFQSASDLAFALEALWEDEPAGPAVGRVRSWKWVPWAVAGLAVVVGAALAFLGVRSAALPEFQRLTFRRGTVHVARFTPDGASLVYSARWEGEPSAVFTARLDSPAAASGLGTDQELRAISAGGEVALLQRVHLVRGVPVGALARSPLNGGSPRVLEENVAAADWTPDGKQLAVVRVLEGATEIEFPAGRVLYRTSGFIRELRFSPAGDRIAFIERQANNAGRGVVWLVDLAGAAKAASGEHARIDGLAWHPGTGEIWFSSGDLWAVRPGGRERVVGRQAMPLRLHDIAKDGRVLAAAVDSRMRAVFRGSGDGVGRELSWLDYSSVQAMGGGGRFVVLAESGEGAGGEPKVFLREVGGVPATLVGPGLAASLSEDGREVVVVNPDGRGVTVYPMGPGTARSVGLAGFAVSRAGLLPAGRVWFQGAAEGQRARFYTVDVTGGIPRSVTREEGTGIVSPDGRFILTPGGLYPVAGGDREGVKGIGTDEILAGFASGGNEVFVASTEIPGEVSRVNWLTGARVGVRKIEVSDPAGVQRISRVVVSGDGTQLAYSYSQILSELLAVQGWR